MKNSRLINNEEAMERLLGNKEMYIRWLREFFSSDYITELERDVISSQYETAHYSSHRFKGVVMNLSLTRLAESALLLDEAIKAKSDSAVIKQAFARVKDDYNSTYNYFLEAFQGGK